MSKSFRGYLFRIHIFSILLGTGLYFFNQQESIFQFQLFWIIQLVFHLASIFVFLLLHKANEESPKKFIRSFMAVSFIKLLSALFAVAVGGLLYKKQAAGLIMNLMVMYLAYLVFDVVLLMKTINKK